MSYIVPPSRTPAHWRLHLAIAGFGLLAGACSTNGPTTVDVGFDDQESRILVLVNRPVQDGERLHTRVRMGQVGELDCKRDSSAIPRIDKARHSSGKATYAGPVVDEAIFEPIYDDSWLEMEPTEEMLEAIALGRGIIDICLMNDDGVVVKAEFDVRRALDRSGGNGKADGEEERIASTEAYTERCMEELGDIPFFEPLGDGDYSTYNCLDSEALATTVTDAEGNVTFPTETVNQCDNPQYIYSLCEPNAVDGQTNGPRVASRSNDKGTSWVMLCRKAKEEEGAYNDIAMIGHNPFTGKTCFFQNALYSRTDGLKVPHPGDRVESEASPAVSATLWSGIHGGLGSGIQCAKCHDADPFVHTPWIDQAKNQAGDPVIPKMGIHEDFALGFNDAPYSIVNTQGQGWTMPKHLTSPEAEACTRCHRIGDGRWSDSWIDRLVGQDQGWVNITSESHRSFEKTFWMPPDLDGLDDASWSDSDFGKAVAFIQECGNNAAGCEWAELPTDPIAEDGELPTIDLEGAELAKAATMVLGANVDDASCPDGNCSNRRCAECHSLSKNGLNRWLEFTDHAWDECGVEGDIESMSPQQAQTAIDCMKVDPSDPSSVFAAANVGILTTGVQYGPFRELFRKAYGEDEWLVPYVKFKSRVGMPKGSHPKFSQREFAIVRKWFKNDLNNMSDVLIDPPAPASCVAEFDQPEISAYLAQTQFDGWEALNADDGIRMYGCSGDEAIGCLAGFPNRTADWGNGIGVIRELKELGFRTSFWTRSSADGRFVGNGGGSSLGSTITDLQTGKNIPVDASYDPGFFPDNSGFIFQGVTGGAGLCSQNVLTRHDQVTFEEPECSTASGINLYQHVARGIDSGDYFVINSPFTSDSGSASSDPRAPFAVNSEMKFTPMVFDGTNYEPMAPVRVDAPYEGDSVLSPSAGLVASRLAGQDGKSLGYVIRRVQTSRFGDAYQVNVSQKLATVCMPGAKASFSFDERFMVTHHYHDGTADILMLDLQTNMQYTLTNMPVGVEARFPHFRSDGWIYFLVDAGDTEYMAASDAALRLAQ